MGPVSGSGPAAVRLLVNVLLDQPRDDRTSSSAQRAAQGGCSRSARVRRDSGWNASASSSARDGRVIAPHGVTATLGPTRSRQASCDYHGVLPRVPGTGQGSDISKPRSDRTCSPTRESMHGTAGDA